MAKQLYLNDCLPETTNRDVLQIFETFLIRLVKLYAQKKAGLSNILVLSNKTDKLSFCGKSFNELYATIYGRNKDLYNSLGRILSKTNILGDADEVDLEDESLQNDCRLDKREAWNLMVAAKSGYIAASLPVDSSLEVDQLSISVIDKAGVEISQCSIDNWYGDNTDYLLSVFTPYDFCTDFQKTLGISKIVVASDLFKEKWETLKKQDQRKVMNRFLSALNNQLLFPARPDGDIVKQDATNGSHVHELRHSDGHRVYFECDVDAIYIALYASKSNSYGANQSSDFNIARGMIKKLRENL